MKKILVPTDFSPNAARAIDYAVQIAKLNQATIQVIHACDLMDTSYGNRIMVKEEYNKTVTDEAFAKLDMIRKSIEETEQIVVNIRLYNGGVIDSILVAAREYQADLVIMGTLGVSGLRDAIFGSMTAAVLGKTEVPLLAIPLEYDWSRPKRFLFTVNQFEEAANLAGPVFELARVFGAEVEVAVFTNEDEVVSPEFREHDQQIAGLEKVLREKYQSSKIHHQHLTGHRFDETLNEHIRQSGMDLLAMIKYKRSFIEGIFHRSYTRHMAYHSKVPLLVIPATETH